MRATGSEFARAIESCKKHGGLLQLGAAGEFVNAAQTDELFDSLDVDGSGALDFAEFVSLPSAFPAVLCYLLATCLLHAGYLLATCWLPADGQARARIPCLTLVS